jgi:leucyl aminopeptidase
MPRRHFMHFLPLALLSTPALASDHVSPATAPNSRARSIGFASEMHEGSALVIPMESAQLPDDLLDESDAEAVAAAISAAKFEGKAGSSLSLRGIGDYPRILLIGTGNEGSELHQMQMAGGRAAQELRDEDSEIVIAGGASAEQAYALATGYAMGQYRFDRYKTVGKKTPPAKDVTILTDAAKDAVSMWQGKGMALIDGIELARDTATEPANVKYPQSFVTQVSNAFRGVAKVKIEVLDEKAMRRLGMGAILSVGQGSRKPPRLMLVNYNGGGQKAPLAFVGKGITFDSGGISIKPAAGMWAMKADMSAAASIMGAVLSLAKSKAAVNVIGVAALAENVPGGNATRPGDVVRSMSGKTIEVLNTDAEGRLVLADANEYVVAKRKPAAVVNMATLTGSIVAALGDEYAGLFARDDKLAMAITAAGNATAEEVWRMPLHKNYLDDMKSEIADIKNVVEGGGPGAGLGASFVGYFVDAKTPWAHLDIAGVNWTDKAGAVTPKGASGWGVRLLDQLARDWYAK